jgi:prespore-specific regulator
VINVKRNDSWTAENDLLLAKTVLDYVRSGKTQLEAFVAIGTILHRTSSACSVRWNLVVRKQYSEEIKEAKLNSKKPNSIADNQCNFYLTENVQVPQLLETKKPFYDLARSIEDVELAFNELKKDNLKLQMENVTLREKLNSQPDQNVLNTLLKLLDRARELGIINNESPAV